MLYRIPIEMPDFKGGFKMIKSKVYGFLFLSLFLIGGLSVLPERAYSGVLPTDLGCCLNVAGFDTCHGCSGNPPCQIERGDCRGQVTFDENEFCSTVGGGEAVCITEAPVGCCQIGADTCGIITKEACDTEPWTFGTLCVEGSCGSAPTGCCVIEVGMDDDDDLECESDLTQMRCEEPPNSGEWTIGGTCGVTSTCLGPGPVSAAIPTMSQWGLIATAGILALFSLFYIIRRKSYNG